MKSNNDFAAILDDVTAEIRNETVDPSVVDQAAERVWARLASEALETGGQLTTESLVADRIGSCADFQSLIPAYLNGSLSEGRSLLLVDHTHECIPCRKAMKDARLHRMAPAKMAVVTRRYSIQPVVLRWGIAASLIIGIGLLALPFIQRYAPLGGDLERPSSPKDRSIKRRPRSDCSPARSFKRASVFVHKSEHAVVRLVMAR